MNIFSRYKLKSLRSKVQKIHDQREARGSNQDVKGEVAAQFALAKFYERHIFDSGLPRAEDYALECYRAAAALGDARAEFICGQRLLEKAKFWDAWSRGPLYAAPIHKKYAASYYEEALAYLRAAEAHDYALAKRLLGMAHIHGWGVTKDMQQGYKLVIDSIELEKAWGRATKIFEELKLNSPEFFAALQSYKK